MTKRNLRPVAIPDALAELGERLPTQNVKRTTASRPKPAPKSETAAVEPAPQSEQRVQLKLNVRESLHTELQHKALAERTTVQALILRALKSQGLTVLDEDLIDRRKLKKKTSI